MIALGVALFVVAMALFLAEAHLSTGGVLGIAASVTGIGAVALLLLAAGASGAVVLVVAFCVVAACVSLLVLARQRILLPLLARPRTGREALVGHVGVVRVPADDGEAEVFVDGSLWRAEPDPLDHETALHEGDRVVVEHVNGLTLRVRKAEAWELSK